MLTFPLSFEQFAGTLRVASLDWDLSENRQVSEDGGGNLLIADNGPRLWGGTIAVTPHSHAHQRKAQALLQALRQGVATFYVGDKMARFPAADPGGLVLGAAVLTLSSPVTGSSTINLAGLPADYEMTPGDYLSFDYGAGRRALHQVYVGGRAAADSTISLSVVPAIRPGATDGTAVTLIGATCKAVVVPGSVKTGTIGRGGITGGFSFAFRQSLR